jgi:predicted membrane channel-forming protein YqfA (hemolysin III family)
MTKLSSLEHKASRLKVFLVTATIGVLPTVQYYFWIEANDVYRHLKVQVVERIFWLFVYFGIGFAFYLFRIPERWIRHWTIDYFFQSHIIWHLLTAYSASYHVETCSTFISARVPCS